MTRELKRLKILLEKWLLDIESGACDDIPPMLITQYTKTADEFSKMTLGDDLLTLDEVCEELNIGKTSLDTLITNGDINPPEPLHKENKRVGIRRKYVQDIKQKRQ